MLDTQPELEEVPRARQTDTCPPALRWLRRMCRPICAAPAVVLHAPPRIHVVEVGGEAPHVLRILVLIEVPASCFRVPATRKH